MEPGEPRPDNDGSSTKFATWGSSGHSQQQRLSAIATAPADAQQQQQGGDTPASSKYERMIPRFASTSLAIQSMFHEHAQLRAS
jgi:hypothetical protein